MFEDRFEPARSFRPRNITDARTRRLRKVEKTLTYISSQCLPNRSTIARQAFQFALGHRSAQDTSLACLPDSVGLRLAPMDGNGELPLDGAIHRTKPKLSSLAGARSLSRPLGLTDGLELTFTA